MGIGRTPASVNSETPEIIVTVVEVPDADGIRESGIHIEIQDATLPAIGIATLIEDQIRVVGIIAHQQRM